MKQIEYIYIYICTSGLLGVLRPLVPCPGATRPNPSGLRTIHVESNKKRINIRIYNFSQQSTDTFIFLTRRAIVHGRNRSRKAPVALFGICVKSAAQRWGREPLKRSVGLLLGHLSAPFLPHPSPTHRTCPNSCATVSCERNWA